MAMKELHFPHRHSVACSSSVKALFLWPPLLRPEMLFINSSPSFATGRIINLANDFRTVSYDSREHFAPFLYRAMRTCQLYQFHAAETVTILPAGLYSEGT